VKTKFNRSDYNAMLEQIYDEFYLALTKMQNDYDGETANGRIEQMQMIWNKKIDQQLVTLSTN